MRRASELEVEGKRLEVSNLDKVLYPKTGFTKAQVLDYYIRISPVLLPHLHDRPLTLKRYPEGVDKEFFYEKQCPGFRPEWMQTAPVRSRSKDKTIRYCLVNDLPALVWAANLADLELHTSMSRYPDVASPTMVVFDLDPGLPATVIDCARAAVWLKAELDSLGLQSFPKTSGSKGLQIYVPLNTPANYDMTKSFARRTAERLERDHPEKIVAKMAKSLRQGKIFVDWSQNDPHKTTVCVYSLRAMEAPTVSTPVTWGEVAQALAAKEPATLRFTSGDAIRRVEEQGDLFAPALNLKQRCPNGRHSG